MSDWTARHTTALSDMVDLENKGALSKEDGDSILDMMKSPDLENLTLAETLIETKRNEYEQRRQQKSIS